MKHNPAHAVQGSTTQHTPRKAARQRSGEDYGGDDDELDVLVVITTSAAGRMGVLLFALGKTSVKTALFTCRRPGPLGVGWLPSGQLHEAAPDWVWRLAARSRHITHPVVAKRQGCWAGKWRVHHFWRPST